jgi:hypothetical protein
MCRPSSKDPHHCEQKCFKFENREKSFRRHQSISKSQSNERYHKVKVSKIWIRYLTHPRLFISRTWTSGIFDFYFHSSYFTFQFLMLICFVQIVEIFQYLYFPDTMAPKARWKCVVCEKTLASKQTALQHVKVFHNQSDPVQTILKIITQESAVNQNMNIKKKKSTKKKAFNYFSQLSNMFNDNNLVETFSLSQSKKSTSKEQKSKSDPRNPDPSRSLDQPTNTSPEPATATSVNLAVANNTTLDDFLDPNPEGSDPVDSQYEALVLGNTPEENFLDKSDLLPGLDTSFSDLSSLDILGENDTTYNILFRGSEMFDIDQEPNEYNTTLDEHSVCKSQDVLNKTIYDSTDSNFSRESSHIAASSSVADPISHSDWSVSSSTSANQRSASRLLRSLPSIAIPSPSATIKTVTVPNKTRGHCGNPECAGCNREPCGTCINCIHKKQRR